MDQQPEWDDWFCDCGRINSRGQILCESCGNGSRVVASGERVPLPRNDRTEATCPPIAEDA